MRTLGWILVAALAAVAAWLAYVGLSGGPAAVAGLVFKHPAAVVAGMLAAIGLLAGVVAAVGGASDEEIAELTREQLYRLNGRGPNGPEGWD